MLHEFNGEKMNNQSKAVDTKEGALILDSHKLSYHFDRVQAWENGERISPVSVDMALTRACGAMCSFCYAMIQEPQERASIKTKEALKILDSLKLMQDIDRLKSRRPRTGKSALRGRTTKIGKSVLFVVSNAKKLSSACGSIPGVDVQTAKNLSVLDLAPGGVPIRLVIYSKNALKEIEKIKSPHLELLVNVV